MSDLDYLQALKNGFHSLIKAGDEWIDVETDPHTAMLALSIDCAGIAIAEQVQRLADAAERIADTLENGNIYTADVSLRRTEH